MGPFTVLMQSFFILVVGVGGSASLHRPRVWAFHKGVSFMESCKLVLGGRLKLEMIYVTILKASP